MGSPFAARAALGLCFTTAIAAAPAAARADAACPPLHARGVLQLPWQPAFMEVSDYDAGPGLTISSFFNVHVVPGATPPFMFFARDRVARILLDALDPDAFDAATDVEDLTDVHLPPFVPFGATVWPNEATRAPEGMFPFEAIVIPQGFHPAVFPGRLTAVDVATKQEYVIHQSTQGAGGPTFPGDPANSPRFYHRALFHDMNGDGLLDVVSARSGFRVGAFVFPPFAELVWFENPGAAIDPATPWRETVLWGGPAAGFMGPDIHLELHDFEGDGVPELVATHFFTGGTIALYGAPAGGTWADVNAAAFALPRVAVLSADQGSPFDLQITDLDRDGRADILATNHQPDNCTPATSSEVPGRVYALVPPDSGDLFGAPWTTHVLLDDIRPNPSLPPVTPPGRLAPGRAQAFWPIRLMEWFAKPWIVVGGDEASAVWVLVPRTPWWDDWRYDAHVVFEIDDVYGPGTTQTRQEDPAGRTISTIGGIAWRYDAPGPLGFAELYIPAFEARDVHVMSFRPRRGDPKISCVERPVRACAP